MPLFGRNKKIGEHLEKKAKEVFEHTVEGKKYGAPLPGATPREAWSAEQVTNYFLGVGTQFKGDFQSYMFEKGTKKSVEVKIDLVALAAACAGCPLPETPLFAEVGAKVAVTNTKNNLVIAAVGPSHLSTGEELHSVLRPVVFLAMTGYRFAGEVAVSVEVGVKTPDVPGLPKPTGGEWSSEKPEVESGTYAELAAFELGAKASAKATAGITGERLYVSDPVPTFIGHGGPKGARDTIHHHLLGVLENGDKKAVIKEEVEKFFEAKQTIKALKPELSRWKKHITGGGITTSTFLEQLAKARKTLEAIPDDPGVQECDHHSKTLQDYKEAAVLKPYCYLAMWSMKPEASAGVSASATASMKANVGLASGGGEASVTVTGPSISTLLKFTMFRLQYVVAATTSRGTRARSNAIVGRPSPRARPAPTGATPTHYAVTTQDTRIDYGQMDLTALGIDAKIELGVAQGVVSREAVREGNVTRQHRSSVGEARVSAEGAVGIEELKGGLSASASLKKTLNFMQYTSAIASWAPPQRAGSEEGEIVTVKLATGTGWAWGQSVDSANLYRHYKKFQQTQSVEGYFEALAGSIGVSPTQMKAFLEADGGMWIELFGNTLVEPSDPSQIHVCPDAFLLEATFKPRVLPSVEAKWQNGRWTLGPFNVLGTLRDVIVPRTVDGSSLQALRLRYRRSDKDAKSKTLFSLGFKYIASLGISYESIENAGSESVIDVYTHWYNEFGQFNAMTDWTAAYSQGVTRVALVHQ